MEDFVCPYCGALLVDEHEECPYCGRVLKEKNEQPKSGDYFDPTIRGNKSDEWILKWKNKQIPHNTELAIGTGIIFSVIIIVMIVTTIASIHGDGNYLGRDFVKAQISLCIIFSIVFAVIGLVLIFEITRKKFYQAKVDGFNILVAQYGNFNFLVCDDVVLDEQKYVSNRFYSDLRTLKGTLPNGKNIWVEFRPGIKIHVGKDRVLKKKEM
ncbi:MAG: hypothetical protein J6T15_05885 [Bacilli bacterium]|nr:hypothetical protein [Bacilli bacterium]